MHTQDSNQEDNIHQLPPVALRGIHQDAYNAIVKPEQKFAVSHYFLKRWGPLLGPAATWFIIALRQRCFWNGKQNWCVVDSATLAREAAMSDRTLFRLIEDNGLVSWFFRRERRRHYNRQARRSVLAPNLYTVCLDDPLVPADQAGLAALLRKHALPSSDPVQATMELLTHLLDLKDHLLPEELTISAEEATSLTPKNFTVYDVVRDVLPDIIRIDEEQRTRLGQLCSELQNKISQPERVYIGTQYFRLKWLPRLGHTLASFIVALRTRCYWNEKTGELRDSLEVNLEEVAAEIGCTARWLRKLRRQEYASLFIEELEMETGRGSFRVQMRDPLIPEDQALFEKMTASPHPHLKIDPQTGQISAIPLLEQAQEPPEPPPLEIEPPPGDTSFLSPVLGAEFLADTGRNFWQIRGIPAEFLADTAELLADSAEFLADRRGEGTNSTEKALISHTKQDFKAFFEDSSTISAQKTPNSGANVPPHQCGIFGRTVKVLISTISTRGKLQQQYLEAKEKDFVVVAVSLLLECFGLHEPGKSHLLEMGLSYIDAFAWMLYAFTQPSLANKCQGYVYNRLIARDPPPEDFRLFAQLPPPVWKLFYKADRYGLPVSEELRPAFELWRKVYSGFFSAEPFEDWKEQESAIEADEDREMWPKALARLEGYLDETFLENLRQCHVVKSDAGRWVILVNDLFTAYQLGQAREMIETVTGCALEVRDWSCGKEISPEVMAFKGLSPLPGEVWSTALAELALQMSQATFNSWLRDSRPVGWIQADKEGGEIIIGVHSEYAREWLENRHRHLIERTLMGIIGRPVSVRFIVMYGGSFES